MTPTLSDSQRTTSAGDSEDGSGSSPRAGTGADDAGPEQPPPASSGGGLDIEINDPSRLGGDLDLPWLATRLRAAADHVGEPVERIGVTLVDDARITALHLEHQDIDQTTDVLTFPLSDAGAAIDVDVVVCVDEATRQARERGHAVERELLLYCLHGLLHCAGYDDGGGAEFTRMHEREDRILEAIGVGATFHHDDGRSEP